MLTELGLRKGVVFATTCLPLSDMGAVLLRNKADVIARFAQGLAQALSNSCYDFGFVLGVSALLLLVLQKELK